MPPLTAAGTPTVDARAALSELSREASDNGNMTTTRPTEWTIELYEDRVRRAGEIRDEIGHRWEDFAEHPRRLTALPGQNDCEWVFGVRTVIPMPIRLSTLFGEWLYELRAALDGTAYHLAVCDS